MIRSIIITAFVCCATMVCAEWPTYHGQPDLNGLVNDTLPESPQLLWRYNAGREIYNTPVSDGKHIFFADKKGKVIALDLKGSEVWSATFIRSNDAGQIVAARFEAPLACSDGLVFAGTTRGLMYALDAQSGEVKWEYDTGGTILGSPNFVKHEADTDRPEVSGFNDKDAKKLRKENLGIFASSRSNYSAVVVLDQSEGALHCLNIQTGTIRWKTEGVERCDGSPGIGCGKIVFGSCLAALHVYSLEGKHLRDIEVGGDGQIAGGVAIAGALAYAGTRDGSLLCVDLEKGKLLWSSNESEDQTFATPAIAKDRVIYASDDGFVRAIERKSEKRLWKFDTGGLPASPAIAGDKVAVSVDGELILLNLEDGKKRWSKEISDEISSPAIIHGMIVVGADDGTVNAWGVQ